MSNTFLRISVWVYLALFFSYLLGPLFIMAFTAFNSSGFPRISPWECLTFEWFTVLFNDERILNGIKNSLLVGAGTVVLSVSMGLAGALILTQVWPKLRATYYTVIIAPILVPGVVLGISTVVFWQRVNEFFGLSPNSLLSDGLFLTIMGQSTFIASYCMLVLVARLQRYDLTLNEAALDLGATHAQAFRKILLPFMKPAIASAAVLAFLASFENYNTTTFTFGDYPTLTIELSQKVRYGINPSISALAFIIILVTILAALMNEAIKRRRELQAAANGATVAKVESGFRLPRFLSRNPALIALVILSVGIVTTVGTATAYSPDQCKIEVQEAKDDLTARRIQQLRAARDAAAAARAAEEAKTFGGAFEVEGLTPSDGSEEPAAQGGGAGAFGGVFAPGNLSDEEEGSEGGAEDTAPANPFGSVFEPGNLSTESGSDSSN